MVYIQLNSVYVDFPIFNAQNRSVKKGFFNKVIGGRLSRPKGIAEVRALDNITLNLYQGDRIGLVGHNGAGKTTLLRVLAGVYPPTKGSITCSGKIAPLFDISLGFDLEASGFDNIFLRGLFLGLSKTEINNCIDEIIDFTGLGSFLEMPLRTYSSGMLMRLAFAIATEIQPDIILMDEWISVGDARFLEQARRRLERFIDKSSIMVLASHSEDLIRSTCNKAILMGQGQILAQGSVDEVYNHYNFFGSSNFFDMQEYINLHPDLKEAIDVPGMAPWMHFIKYGIFEGRSPGVGIPLEAFEKDRIFNQAVAIKDGLAAAERIERVAPFLETYRAIKGYEDTITLPYPEDFIASENHPLISKDTAHTLNG
ncbi:ABC transporter ATP-binding protein [Rhodospirillaceae bacterium]|nr:ABC transporter ATP-binding protein [Rhodospirillaceae bacterium]